VIHRVDDVHSHAPQQFYESVCAPCCACSEQALQYANSDVGIAQYCLSMCLCTQQVAHTERGAAAAAADTVYDRHYTSTSNSSRTATTVRRRPASASHTRQASCPPVLLRSVVSGESQTRPGSTGTVSSLLWCLSASLLHIH
jgi:hypothetical protein